MLYVQKHDNTMHLQVDTYVYTVVNIWSGSKKFIKVVLRQERILFLWF